MENKDYIKIPAPIQLPPDFDLQRKLDDRIWKQNVFFHLLSFYKNYDSGKLKQKIEKAKQNPKLKVENEIAKFMRNYFRNNDLFCYQGFLCEGGILNDEDIEGIYDISFLHSFWRKNKQEIVFHFECKNLSETQDLIKKYVYYNAGNKIYDGGVYRYFNGKYAQDQDFGGMIGFVLNGNSMRIKAVIQEKLKEKFDTSPNGDLIGIKNNSVGNNEFTFDSFHSRNNSEFVIHHLLFDFI